MKKSEKTQDIWYNLDNAANIFPAISNERNTNVFRLSCELREIIDPSLLQQALDQAMKHFAYFQVVMRRGLFWFYLERTNLKPEVEMESSRPCGRLFYKSRKDLLFRMSYYRQRINLEVFHSVSDGGGAVELLRTVVYNYIVLRHRVELPHALPSLDNATNPAHASEDSFLHHYDPDNAVKRSPLVQERAYTIGGTAIPAGNIQVISGTMPTKQVLALAKSRGVTVTAYLCALMICAIYCELTPKRAAQKTIAVNVPVDLRNLFASESARNFFSVVEVSHNFGGAPADFDAVLEAVSKQLAEKLQVDAITARLNYTMGVQKNIFARSTPLFLKNFVLRAAYNKSEHATTCAISNMGRITMPEPFVPYIKQFSCLLNPTPIHRLKACVCSFGDEFVVNFSSCIAETKAQKYFFRHLAENNVQVTITSNGGFDDEAV